MILYKMDSLIASSVEDLCNKLFRPANRKEKAALLAQSGISDEAVSSGSIELEDAIGKALEQFCGHPVVQAGLWDNCSYTFFNVESYDDPTMGVHVFLYTCPAFSALLNKKEVLPLLLGIDRELDEMISPKLKEN